MGEEAGECGSLVGLGNGLVKALKTREVEEAGSRIVCVRRSRLGGRLCPGEGVDERSWSTQKDDQLRY